ncbi:hypothetical protein ONZ45_g1057 [Pleurotus djamor]|nr:hypothetical protein ONZ45_g1057 [Pleurotus djamor]
MSGLLLALKDVIGEVEEEEEQEGDSLEESYDDITMTEASSASVSLVHPLSSSKVSTSPPTSPPAMVSDSTSPPHSIPDLLSPVGSEVSNLPSIPFPLRIPSRTSRREDSFDSGYADSWHSPHPLVLSPPRSPAPSSTFDILISPFGTPSARVRGNTPVPVSPLALSFDERSTSPPLGPRSDDVESDLDHNSPNHIVEFDTIPDSDNSPTKRELRFPRDLVETLRRHSRYISEDLDEPTSPQLDTLSAAERSWELSERDPTAIFSPQGNLKHHPVVQDSLHSQHPTEWLEAGSTSFNDGEISPSFPPNELGSSRETYLSVPPTPDLVPPNSASYSEESSTSDFVTEDMLDAENDIILPTFSPTARLAYTTSPELEVKSPPADDDTLYSFYDVYTAESPPPEIPKSSAELSPSGSDQRAQTVSTNHPSTPEPLFDRLVSPSSSADVLDDHLDPIYSSEPTQPPPVASPPASSSPAGQKRRSFLKPLRLSTISNLSSSASRLSYTATTSSAIVSNSTSMHPLASAPSIFSSSKRSSIASIASTSVTHLSRNSTVTTKRTSCIPSHITNTFQPHHDQLDETMTNMNKRGSASTFRSSSRRQSTISYRRSNAWTRDSRDFTSHNRSNSNFSEPTGLYDVDEDPTITEDDGYSVHLDDDDDERIYQPLPTPNTAPPSRAPSVMDSPHAIATPSPNLIFAIASDDVDQLRRVLAHGDTNPNERMGPQSALAFTITNEALENKLAMVKVLLAHGADPKGLDQEVQRRDSRSSLRGESPAPEVTQNTLSDGIKNLDPATQFVAPVTSLICLAHRVFRYYIKRAGATHTRQTSALIFRSFFRPLTKVRYEMIGQDRALEQLFKVLSIHSKQLSVAPIVVLLCGPSGHGKSLLARRFGSLLDVPTHTVNMTTVRSTLDLWRSYSLSPYEEPSSSTLAEFLVENEGKRCVVVLDEIEKTEDSKALHSLLMPWELGRCSFEAGSRHVDVRNVIWLGTSNIGQDLVFEHQAARGEPDSLMSREEYVQLMGLLRPKVSDQLGTSILSRVTTVLPFVSFTTDEKMAIISEAFHALAGDLLKSIPNDSLSSMIREAMGRMSPIAFLRDVGTYSSLVTREEGHTQITTTTSSLPIVIGATVAVIVVLIGIIVGIAIAWKYSIRQRKKREAAQRNASEAKEDVFAAHPPKPILRPTVPPSDAGVGWTPQIRAIYEKALPDISLEKEQEQEKEKDAQYIIAPAKASPPPSYTSGTITTTFGQSVLTPVSTAHYRADRNRPSNTDGATTRIITTTNTGNTLFGRGILGRSSRISNGFRETLSSDTFPSFSFLPNRTEFS